MPIEIDNFEQQGCQEIAVIEDGNKVLGKEMHVMRDGRWFAVTVATPDYIREIQQVNSNLPPESQRFDRFLPMSVIGAKEDVCLELAKLNMPQLQPYLQDIPANNPTNEPL